MSNIIGLHPHPPPTTTTKPTPLSTILSFINPLTYLTSTNRYEVQLSSPLETVWMQHMRLLHQYLILYHKHHQFSLQQRLVKYNQFLDFLNAKSIQMQPEFDIIIDSSLFVGDGPERERKPPQQHHSKNSTSGPNTISTSTTTSTTSLPYRLASGPLDPHNYNRNGMGSGDGAVGGVGLMTNPATLLNNLLPPTHSNYFSSAKLVPVTNDTKGKNGGRGETARGARPGSSSPTSTQPHPPGQILTQSSNPRFQPQQFQSLLNGDRTGLNLGTSGTYSLFNLPHPFKHSPPLTPTPHLSLLSPSYIDFMTVLHSTPVACIIQSFIAQITLVIHLQCKIHLKYPLILPPSLLALSPEVVENAAKRGGDDMGQGSGVDKGSGNSTTTTTMTTTESSKLRPNTTPHDFSIGQYSQQQLAKLSNNTLLTVMLAHSFPRHFVAEPSTTTTTLTQSTTSQTQYQSTSSTTNLTTTSPIPNQQSTSLPSPTPTPTPLHSINQHQPQQRPGSSSEVVLSTVVEGVLVPKLNPKLFTNQSSKPPIGKPLPTPTPSKSKPVHEFQHLSKSISRKGLGFSEWKRPVMDCSVVDLGLNDAEQLNLYTLNYDLNGTDSYQQSMLDRLIRDSQSMIHSLTVAVIMTIHPTLNQIDDFGTPDRPQQPQLVQIMESMCGGMGINSTIIATALIRNIINNININNNTTTHHINPPTQSQPHRPQLPQRTALRFMHKIITFIMTQSIVMG